MYTVEMINFTGLRELNKYDYYLVDINNIIKLATNRIM